MITLQDLNRSLLDPVTCWSTADPALVRLLLGEEAAAMVGFAQRNPHHCYTLFDHCLHTVAELDTERALTDAALLRTAALFHDIAKPEVAFEKQGRLVFYGHARRSAEMAQALLSDIGFSAAEVELMCFWIAHHDDFISYVLPTEDYDRSNPYLTTITEEHVLGHIREAAAGTPQAWHDLMLLCCADASAQSEIVYRDGVPVDSRGHKVMKHRKVMGVIDTLL